VIDTGRVVVREKDPARERRRISRQREKRATLILGLIMGAFIACWLPFFFLYLLAPVCPSCNIQPWGFAFAFWLGYINSALNPVSHFTMKSENILLLVNLNALTNSWLC
jgi:hypothetical protein